MNTSTFTGTIGNVKQKTTPGGMEIIEFGLKVYVYNQDRDSGWRNLVMLGKTVERFKKVISKLDGPYGFVFTCESDHQKGQDGKTWVKYTVRDFDVVFPTNAFDELKGGQAAPVSQPASDDIPF